MSLRTDVSIIVPYYNSKGYIGRLLESVSAQSHPEFLCILVDDGGSDGTFELVEETTKDDPRFLNVKRPEGYGSGGRGSKNFGFSLADSEFIVFFDSDDVMYPDFLRDRMAFLLANPEKDGVVSDFGWRVRPGEYKRTYRYNRALFNGFQANVRQDWFWLHYMDYRFWFNPGNPMWRRTSIADKPLWDESTSIGEDHEYHARLMLSGLDIGIIDGVYWDYMANSDSMIATSESVAPLLSRSHGKMLVLENIFRHLGPRKTLARKELNCQVKILRRIMSCESTSLEKDAALDTMMGRIEKVMDLMGYTSIRIALVSAAIRAAAGIDERMGGAHRLYTFMVPDRNPTDEGSFFTIS
jgi:glycosyltransferase involved in cell wall biosynthesis